MKRIFVNQNFGGKETGELRILPGEYEITDPKLFGLAQYLVETGRAVEIKSEAVPVKEATKAVEIQTVSIEPDAPEETGVDVDRSGRPAVKPPKGK